jgi:hypothetical protein
LLQPALNRILIQIQAQQAGSQSTQEAHGLFEAFFNKGFEFF